MHWLSAQYVFEVENGADLHDDRLTAAVEVGHLQCHPRPSAAVTVHSARPASISESKLSVSPAVCFNTIGAQTRSLQGGLYTVGSGLDPIGPIREQVHILGGAIPELMGQQGVAARQREPVLAAASRATWAT